MDQTIMATQLICAVRANDLHTINQLFNAGYSVNKSDGWGWTPLLEAVDRGNFNMVRVLLEHGADPYYVAFSRKENPIMLSVRSGYYDIVQLFLDYGISPNFNIEDRSVLHLASDNHHPDIVNLLIDRGADVNVQDNYGKTPLYSAVANRDYNMINLLLSRGASPHCQTNNKDPSINTIRNATLLHVSVNNGDYDLTEFLLKLGVNPNITDEYQKTPLFLVTKANNYEFSKLLLDYGSDPSIRDVSGKTALHYTKSIAIKNLIQSYEIPIKPAIEFDEY